VCVCVCEGSNAPENDR